MKIEKDQKRRVVEDGFKLYGTKEEFEALRDAITKALNAGLVQGWVGVGVIDDERTVFPHNGRNNIKDTNWHE